MRVVTNPGDLAAKVQEAAQEAGAAFGNPSVFIERYRPRQTRRDPDYRRPARQYSSSL